MQARAFSLIELLVVISIIALLAALTPSGLKLASDYSKRTAALANMRQVGVGFNLYAADNDLNLPLRSIGTDDKWPHLIHGYLASTKPFIAPDDEQARTATPEELIANNRNRTSFFMNGFNDLGSLENPGLMVKLPQIATPSNTLLLAQKKPASSHYYVDIQQGDQNSIMIKDAYSGGANYVFADGSARYIKVADYDDRMWLVNPDYAIPAF